MGERYNDEPPELANLAQSEIDFWGIGAGVRSSLACSTQQRNWHIFAIHLRRESLTYTRGLNVQLLAQAGFLVSRNGQRCKATKVHDFKAGEREPLRRGT